MLLAFFLIHPTQAHVPHDTVAALGLPPDLNEDDPWTALVPAHLPLLEVRNPQGFYEMRGGEPMGDTPVGLGQLADGTIVVLGATQLWWSTDLAQWSHAPLPGVMDHLITHEQDVILSGPEGIWQGLPESLEQISTDVARFTSYGAALSYVDTQGGIWEYNNDNWEKYGEIPNASAVLATGEALFVGTLEGKVFYREGDTWAPCGALSSEGKDNDDVVVISADQLDPHILYVGTGLNAPYQSTDSCQTFNNKFAFADIDYQKEGAPDSPQVAITDIIARGEKIVLASWNGLYISEDQGKKWIQKALLPADYLRGLAVSKGPQGQTVVIEGPYASGPIRSCDEGKTWTGINSGLTDDNVQEVNVDSFNPDIIYTITGHLGFSSQDGGASWNNVNILGNFDPDETQAETVWANAETIVKSADGGITWENISGLPAIARMVAHLHEKDGIECVVTSTAATVWCKEGETWVKIFESEDRAMAAESIEGDIILAMDNEIITIDENGSQSRLGPLTNDHLLSMAKSDNQNLFVGSQSGLVYRSIDKGNSWEVFDFRMTSPVWSMGALPDFATRQKLLLGTLDGAFIVDHAGDDDILQAQSSRWAPEQWIDDASAYLSRSNCPVTEFGPGYSLDTRTALIKGCTIKTTLRGSTLRVRGSQRSQGIGHLIVDGKSVADINVAENTTIGILADVQVDFGWHEVELIGEGEGIWFDAIEATTPTTQTPAPEGCGCATQPNPSFALWLLSLITFVRYPYQTLANKRRTA